MLVGPASSSSVSLCDAHSSHRQRLSGYLLHHYLSDLLNFYSSEPWVWCGLLKPKKVESILSFPLLPSISLSNIPYHTCVYAHIVTFFLSEYTDLIRFICCSRDFYTIHTFNLEFRIAVWSFRAVAFLKLHSTFQRSRIHRCQLHLNSRTPRGRDHDRPGAELDLDIELSEQTSSSVLRDNSLLRFRLLLGRSEKWGRVGTKRGTHWLHWGWFIDTFKMPGLPEGFSSKFALSTCSPTIGAIILTSK